MRESFFLCFSNGATFSYGLYTRAFGTSNYSDVNHEACLYRRLPSGSSLESLGRARVIEGGTAVRLDELPSYRKEQELPLAEAALRAPGQFECAFEPCTGARPQLRQSRPRSSSSIPLKISCPSSSCR